MSSKLRCMATIFLSRGQQMLMLYRQGGRVVNNIWVGSAGGHLESEDMNDAQNCVLRELHEELNLSEKQISQPILKYITLRRTEHEIRYNYYFFADLNDNAPQDFISTEGTCKWFAYSELLSLEMPFTAKYVIEHYLQMGIKNHKLYSGIADGNKVIFIELPAF